MKLNMNLNAVNRRYLMIAGIVLGSAALLTYPAILLYRRIRDRRNQEQEEDTPAKAFAPTYRGVRKPHHRKVEANEEV